MTREEAKRRIEICRDFLANNYSDIGEPNFTAFNMAIKALSQEQKSGKWIDKEISNPDYPFQDRKIIECSKCHYGIVQARLGYTNYCPNCGAKMESEE